MRKTAARAMALILAACFVTSAQAQSADCKRLAAILASISAGADPSDEDAMWAASFENGMKRDRKSCSTSVSSISQSASSSSALAKPSVPTGGYSPMDATPVINLANTRPPSRMTLSRPVAEAIGSLPVVTNWQTPHPAFVEGEAATARGDTVAAARAYLSAAQAGDARGHYRYGSALVSGRGVARDPVRGVAFIRVASEVGVGGAGYEMYVAHRDRIAGLTVDNAAMIAYVLQSAASRDAAGEYVLGRVFIDGVRGVMPDIPRGIALVRSSAQKGWADAQHALGSYYEDGVGLPKDNAAAFGWYIKAGNLGHPGAQFNVGRAYNFGIGTGVNVREAVRWYRASAENGEMDGQFAMGIAYRAGIDPDLFDVAKSRYWFGLARAQGHSGAGQQLVSMDEIDRRYAARGSASVAQASRATGPTANDQFFANQRRVQAENCAAAAQGRMRRCNY